MDPSYRPNGEYEPDRGYYKMHVFAEQLQPCRLYCKINSPALAARDLPASYYSRINSKYVPSVGGGDRLVFVKGSRRIEDAAFYQPDIPNERKHATSSFIARNALHELTTLFAMDGERTRWATKQRQKSRKRNIIA